MPITPLHFGLMAPVNRFFRGRISWISFLLVNLWIDLPAILSVIQGSPFPSHDEWGHTFVGATLVAVLIGIFGIRSWPWVLGAFFGAWSHVLLDALVHTDMNPFNPVAMGNPLYLGIMEPLSWLLAPFTVWFTAQIVSDTLVGVRRFLGRPRVKSPESDA